MIPLSLFDQSGCARSGLFWLEGRKIVLPARRPGKAEAHADGHRFGCAIDDMRHDPHALVELDAADDIGDVRVPGRGMRLMDDGEGVDLALARSLAPFDIAPAGKKTDRP